MVYVVISEHFRTEMFELFEHFRTEMFEQLKHYVLNVVIFIILNFRNKQTKNVRKKNRYMWPLQFITPIGGQWILTSCGPCVSLPPSVGTWKIPGDLYAEAGPQEPSRLPLRCALWRGIIYKLSTYPSSCRAEPALHFSGSRCHLLAYGHCTQRRSGNFFFI